MTLWLQLNERDWQTYDLRAAAGAIIKTAEYLCPGTDVVVHNRTRQGCIHTFRIGITKPGEEFTEDPEDMRNGRRPGWAYVPFTSPRGRGEPELLTEEIRREFVR